MGLYRDSSGKLVEVDDDFARSQQLTPVSEATAVQDTAATPEDRGFIGGLNSALTGIESGATLGLSDIALGSVLEDPERERLQGDIETHSTAHTIGILGGSLGASLLGAGPTGMASEAAGNVVEHGLAEGGVIGSAKAIGAMGAEAGLQSGGAYLGDAALADKDVTAEGLLASVAHGAEFGAAFGGAALGVSKGAMSARRLYARYADGAKGAEDAAIAFKTKAQTTLDADEATYSTIKKMRDEYNAAKAEAAKAHRTADIRYNEEKIYASENPARTKEPFEPTYSDPDLGVPRGPYEEPGAGPAPDWVRRRNGQTDAEIGPTERFGPDQEVNQPAKPEWIKRRQGAEGPSGPAEQMGPREAEWSQRRRGTLEDPAGPGQEYGPTTKDTTSSLPNTAADITNPDAVLTVRARDLEDRGYYEPPGQGADKVKAAKAQKAITEGQKDPVRAVIDKDGKIEIIDGRNRLRAAIEADAPIKIQLEEGTAGAGDAVKRGGTASDLEAKLQGTKKALDEGGTLKSAAKIDAENAGKTVKKPVEEMTEAEIAKDNRRASMHDERPIKEYLAEKKLADDQVFGKQMADKFEELDDVLREFEEAKQALDVLKPEGFDEVIKPQRNGVADDFLGDTRGQSRKTLRRERARAEQTGFTRDLAMDDDTLHLPNIDDEGHAEQAFEGKSGKDFADQIAKESLAITRYEKASARMHEFAEADGVADPAGSANAKSFRDAEEEATRKATDRTTRAVEDHESFGESVPAGDLEDLNPRTPEDVYDHQKYGPAEEMGPKEATPQERVRYAKERKQEAKLEYKKAADDAANYEPTYKSATDDIKAKRKAFKQEFGSKAKAAGKVGAAGAATDLGALWEMIPGVPKLSDIPVVGPLLGAYLKFRLAKAAMGKLGLAGRIPATMDAKVAATAAQMRDKIARAVDRSIGLAEAGAKTVAFTAPKLASTMQTRVWDDGQPDAKNKDDVRELVAVRTRELAAYVQTPNAIENDIRKQLIGVTDPDVLASVEKQQRAKMEYLLQHAPTLPQPGALQKTQFMPSAAESMSWARRWAASQRPLDVFLAMQHDSAVMTVEAAETLKSVYPLMYQQAQLRLIERSAEIKASVPYQQRLRMSILYDVPLDSSMDPDNLALFQSSFEKPAQPMPTPGAAPTPMPSIAGNTNLTALFQTSADRRSSR